MKIFEILTEAKVGKQAMDYKRSNRYPDGESIPDSLPPRYQPASFPGVPAGQKCSNCMFYDTDSKKCSKFKGDPVVKPAYWCLKWEEYKEEVTEGVAGPKHCWPGYRKVGTQPGTGKNKGKPVNDCEKIKEESSVEEEWSQKYKNSINCSNPKGFSQKAHCASKNEEVDESLDELARVLELSGLDLTADEQFDIIEEMVEQLALEHGVDPEVIWEDFESVEDDELLESAAWHRSAGKNKNGGLNRKGVMSYRREHPGSKLQTAVTTKPSKLKPGSKAAKRRKSFCARMGGMKGPMKKPNGKPTRKALALRKWNC